MSESLQNQNQTEQDAPESVGNPEPLGWQIQIGPFRMGDDKRRRRPGPPPPGPPKPPRPYPHGRHPIPRPDWRRGGPHPVRAEVLTDAPEDRSVYTEIVEDMARVLHESGREAVKRGQTVAFDKLGDSATRFVEWDEISENAREGRRCQARFLIDHYSNVSEDEDEEDGPDEDDAENQVPFK